VTPGRRHRPSAIVFAAVAILWAAAALAAQSVLTQLGLAETAARNHIIRVVKARGQYEYSDPMVVAGRAGFRKLPAGARHEVAKALFAWAKAYVNSPAFRTAYAGFRQDVVGTPTEYALSVEQEAQKRIDETVAGLEQMIQAAGTLPIPPADRAKLEATAREQLAIARSADTRRQLQEGLTAERRQRAASETANVKRTDEEVPADPNVLFARCLRQFLADTADVDYAAGITNITPYDTEPTWDFNNPAYRKKPFLWMEAVLVGKDTVTAARAVAQAWLNEIGQ
jgi:hypothetical protein